ncbi:MAG: hypothetical protein PHH60_03130 [Candidatus Margulisbacteria bacterium]|nr:hypothetical protein [Candidatus Margulisiibacteriota bacterium]
MHKNIFIALALFCLTLPAQATLSPNEIVNRLVANFSKVRDAQADITLDTSLQILGCGGLSRQTGKLYFKAPDKIMAVVGRDRYFVKGNFIRRIDGDGKRFYVKLIHAPDFSPGFNPRLMTHNFNLKIVNETTEEVVIEGLPKPGVLKNVKKVFFHVDTKAYLLRSIDLSINNNISGKINIDYEFLGGLTVPTACYGKSALEVNNGFLVGLYFNLKGTKFKVNTGLPDKLFDPGF